MKVSFQRPNFIGELRVLMSVTYTAVLPARDETVSFVAGLLEAERRRRGTRAGTRSLSCRDQAVLVLRFFLDDARRSQLAVDNNIKKSTVYDYLNEGINVLAARAPGLRGALLAAKAAGHSHVNIDGTLIETDRVSTPGPTPGVDLWWSGKHDNHGGNIQVVTAPDGWPLWTSDVRPGREHDTTALRTHAEILPLLAEIRDDLRSLGDLGYEGESGTITVAFKKPKNGELTDEQKQFNKAHNGARSIGERGNSLLKTTFKALRNISLNPWRIGKIVAAALVLLHTDHGRTT
jgi:DDE superfamily endonuclease